MTAFIVILSISTAVFLVHLLMGKEMKFERHISIHAPLQQVFDYLKFTKNQDNFSVWNRTDPAMKKDYQGTDAQVGFIYKWDSANKNVGAGEQEITHIKENEHIEYEVRFFKPMKNVAKIAFTLTSENTDQTRVIWSFIGPTHFPMSLFKPIFQKMLGKDLETGLQTLKSIIEK